MKIFVSWSGEQSRQVAEMFSDWVQCVVQACRPWISTRDIDRGSIWFTEISEQLKDISLGVVFLTHENKEKPWIMFESGALAKGLTNNRVCTFLIDITPGDIDDPLAQFNHTVPNSKSVYGLVRTINATCLNPIEERVLENIFKTYWPQFETEFKKIREAHPKTEAGAEPKAEDSSEILHEILSATRTLGNRIARLESRALDNKSDRAGFSEPSSFRVTRMRVDLPTEMLVQAQDFVDYAREAELSAADIYNNLLSYGITPTAAAKIAESTAKKIRVTLGTSRYPSAEIVHTAAG